MLGLGLAILGVLLIGGVAIWATFGGVGILLSSFMEGFPLAFAGQQMYAGMDKWVVLCLPYFILMGDFMAHSGISRALFQFIDDLVGHVPGGMPAAVVLSCMVFGSLTGSSIATVIGIGSIAIPELDRLGYPRKFSCGMMACTGTLGQMIPPSIYAILYGSLTQLDIAVLFVAQIVPGLVTTALLLVPAVLISRREGYVSGHVAASRKQRLHSFTHAVPALILPAIVLGGIYGGVFTPTEAAAVGCVYAFLVGLFVYRGLNMDSIRKALTSSMMTTCTIYLILAACDLFSKPLASAQIPNHIAAWIIEMGLSPAGLLVVISLLYLALGCILDPVPILFLTVPILFPAVTAVGIDPVFFNVMTVSWMMVAQITPPFGISAYALSGHFREPLINVFRGAMPFLAALVVSAFVITYVPQLSLWLPRLLGIH